VLTGPGAAASNAARLQRRFPKHITEGCGLTDSAGLIIILFEHDSGQNASRLGRGGKKPGYPLFRIMILPPVTRQITGRRHVGHQEREGGHSGPMNHDPRRAGHAIGFLLIPGAGSRKEE